MTYRITCGKCGRFAARSRLGSRYVDAGGIDTVVDLVDCPRCGIQEQGFVCWDDPS